MESLTRRPCESLSQLSSVGFGRGRATERRVSVALLSGDSEAVPTAPSRNGHRCAGHRQDRNLSGPGGRVGGDRNYGGSRRGGVPDRLRGSPWANRKRFAL